MRLGIVIGIGERTGAPRDAPHTAADAEDQGLDLVWLEGDRGPEPAPADALTAAAFLAPRTSAVRLAARAGIGPHPILIAEQAAVADNASGGRLTLVLSAERFAGAALAETAQVVLAANGPRPFSHRGERWSVPAGIDGHARERRVSVTPKPAQLELPVWLIGEGAPAAGRELGISHVLESAQDASDGARAWAETERALRRRAARLRRPAIRDIACDPTGDFDDVALTAALIGESEEWGLDVAVLRLPAGLERGARRRAIGRLASLVRPHLLIDRVPAHVEDYWRREVAPRFSE